MSHNVGVRHSGHRKVVNLSQDVRYQDKQRKLMKNLHVHESVKDPFFGVIFIFCWIDSIHYDVNHFKMVKLKYF